MLSAAAMEDVWLELSRQSRLLVNESTMAFALCRSLVNSADRLRVDYVRAPAPRQLGSADLVAWQEREPGVACMACLVLDFSEARANRPDCDDALRTLLRAPRVAINAIDSRPAEVSARSWARAADFRCVQLSVAVGIPSEAGGQRFGLWAEGGWSWSAN